MIFTSKMKLMAAVVLETDVEKVTEALVKIGVVEAVPVSSISGDWVSSLSNIAPDKDGRQATELRTRLEGFFTMPIPPIPLPNFEEKDEEKIAKELSSLSFSVIDKRLDAIATDITALRDKQKSAQDEIMKLEEIERSLSSCDDLIELTYLSNSHSFLAMRFGNISEDKISELSDALKFLPAVLYVSDTAFDGKYSSFIVFLKNDVTRIDSILENVSFENQKYSPKKNDKATLIKVIHNKIDEFRELQSNSVKQLTELLFNIKDELYSIWKKLRFRELVSSVRSSFSKTEKTVVLTGWVPQRSVHLVDKAISEAAVGGYSIEWLEPGNNEIQNIDAPVEMNNPKILQPFESIVKNYAIPEYGTIDPTPFVAIAFLMMFGLMFGDAGHGFVVFLIGLIGTLSAKKSGKPSNLMQVVMWCGLSAIVFGVLFGSYFGWAWFPPLWFNYHGVVNGHVGEGPVRNVYDILGITIKFGMGVLGMGFILNWINLIRKRDWLQFFLDKAGILGGFVYGTGAYTAFYYVGSNYKSLPDMKFLLWFIGVPLIILFFKGPIEFIEEKKKTNKKFKVSMILNFFMEWIVEVLEIFSGYLANTLSFMRVAGLGIAHVSLMTAFFQIANMISPDGHYSIGTILILIVGNILVIALEGLSAGIQSLRLNYYEFFSKYFNGTGKAYSPISLHSKK